MTQTDNLELADEDEVKTAPPPPERAGRSIALTVGLLLFIVVCSVAIFLPLKREAIGLLACGLMLGLIFLRIPVAVSVLVSSLLGMWALRDFRLVEATLAQIPMRAVGSWTLSVIPMFVLMGLLLWRAGLTEKLFVAGRHWLGWLPGGLGVGTNVAGAGLAAVSGSSVGTTYALTRMGVPEMLKAGYHPRYAIGTVIVAGLPGQLIPPSIMLVIYAGIAEVPVGPQLLAGVVPGIFVALLFTLMIVALAVFRPAYAGGSVEAERDKGLATWRDRFASLARIWPVPLVVLVVVVGMFSGTFTATEAGAAAAGVALLITLFSLRRGRALGGLISACVATVSSVGAIFFMLIGVEALSRMLSLTGLSTAFADLVTGMDLSRVQFLLLMMVVYLVLGMFMEPLPMLVLTVPILLPTLESLDVSLLWFGVFAVFMGELAVVTPPVGILSFIMYSILKDPDVNQGHRISIGDVFISILWFMPGALLLVLALIFFPELATFIPDRL